MYSVAELSKRYNVTRATMYKRLKHESIQEFLVNDNRGLRLNLEGLNALNVIMGQNSTPKSQNTEAYTEIHKALTEEKDRRIRALEEEIRELRADKTRLYEELREQRATLTSGEKRGLFKRLFS